MRPFVRLFGKLLPVLLLFAAFSGCGIGVNAHRQGELYLYLNDERYVLTSGLYRESNTEIGRTDDRFTIYEVVGDPEHNYVVVRSFLDQDLYVRESYEKDRTSIEALILNRNEYVYEKDLIDLFVKELIESEEFEVLDRETADAYSDTYLARGRCIDVHIKYPNDVVGESCGSIIYDGTAYWFLNFGLKDVKRVMVSEEIINKLAGYEWFSKLKPVEPPASP